MADLEFIREAADGFTHQGHSSSSTDAYIKVRRSFLNQALRTLKGAPLSIFFAVSLCKDPPDVPTICQLTGYHNETVCIALDFLVERRFLEELGRSGSHGVKVYHPLLSYTYTGLDRDAPPDPELQTDESRNRKIRLRDGNSGTNDSNGVEVGKSDYDDAENPRVRAENPRTNAENPRRIKKQTRKREFDDAENPRTRHDMNDDVQNEIHKENSFIHGSPQEAEATRKILAAAGIEGPNLDALAQRVSVSVAGQWALWLERVDRERWKNPEGYCAKKLLKNPSTEPYGVKPKPPAPQRKGSIVGLLAPLPRDIAEMEDTEL